jgi:hypothetical protein
MAKASGSKRTAPKARRRKSTAAGRKPLGSATMAELRRRLLAVAPTDPEALTPEHLAALRDLLLDRVPKDPPPP